MKRRCKHCGYIEDKKNKKVKVYPMAMHRRNGTGYICTLCARLMIVRHQKMQERSNVM